MQYLVWKVLGMAKLREEDSIVAALLASIRTSREAEIYYIWDFFDSLSQSTITKVYYLKDLGFKCPKLLQNLILCIAIATSSSVVTTDSTTTAANTTQGD